MTRRILIPRNSFGWAGGDIYFKTICRGLEVLKEERAIKTIVIPTYINQLSSKLGRGFLDFERLINAVLGLFWLNVIRPSSRWAPRALVWIPDFQDIDLPANFNEKELSNRKQTVRRNLSKGRKIYLSSNSAREIFSRNYPEYTFDPKVVRFNSLFASEKFLSMEEQTCVSCKDFGYFYVPNQFWVHKNHHLLISAYNNYRTSGGMKDLILSGSNFDYRDTEYGKRLEAIIAGCTGIHNLGFVTRSTQYMLFKNASAVVQPSLYEGWSVSIEEAISFGLPIIASDIKPNLEQLIDYPNAFHFEKNSTQSLQTKLHNHFSNLDANALQEVTDSRNSRFINDLRVAIESYRCL